MAVLDLTDEELDLAIELADHGIAAHRAALDLCQGVASVALRRPSDEWVRRKRAELAAAERLRERFAVVRRERTLRRAARQRD